MLIRVFYGSSCKDITLNNGFLYTIGCSKDDYLSIPESDLKKKHVSFKESESDWQMVCNGTVSLNGEFIKKSILQPKAIYLLSEEYKVSLICLDDNKAKKTIYHFDDLYEFTVGRANDNSIEIYSNLVTKYHARIKKVGDDYYLFDLDSRNGTFVNGTRITKNGSKLKVLDKIIIGDATLIFHGLSFEIIASDDIVRVYNKKERSVFLEDITFKRSPRLKMNVPRGGLEIETPPNIMEKPEINMLSTFLPAIGIIIIAIVMTFASSSSRMLYFTIPMTLIGLVVSVSNYFNQKKKYNSLVDMRLDKYMHHIKSSEEVIKRKQKEQLQALLTMDPETEECFKIVEELDRKLWERRPLDEDFMSVRIGSGMVDSSFSINVPKNTIDLQDDELKKLPQELHQKYHLLKNAPIICDILNNQIIGVVGERKNRAKLLKNIVTQISTHHCYTEVKIIIIYDEKDIKEYKWMEKLPHTWDDDKQYCFVASSRNTAEVLFSGFVDVLKTRRHEVEAEGSYGSSIISVPYYLFIVAQPTFLSKSNPITEFLFDNKELGVGTILAVDNLKQLPKECSQIIEIENAQGEIYTKENSSLRRKFILDNTNENEYETFAISLSHILSDEITVKNVIPKKVSFYEMLNISKVEDIDLLKYWSANDITVSLSTVIGVGEGKNISLDIHEKGHGPHGLVAGMTGSGKSELLQTYILSMALHYHPREVGFVIIDFKGGGMANQFASLPHLMGTITNIEGRAIDRSLVSLKAEVIRRQKVFAEHKVSDIDKYVEKFKKMSGMSPLPHLIIIVDEFAELKSEQPEFMKELISIARIGRSLGIHLILATQKPSGQVSEQIWSNSKFRICLKVASKEDSNEVIRTAAAAKIKEVGRAYLQVGNNEVFELFQSGYGGEKTSDMQTTQFNLALDYIVKYCQKNKIQKLPDICMQALPVSIPYEYKALDYCAGLAVSIGLYDDPANQRQGEVILNLSGENIVIIGSQQTGKTNILQTIIRSACERYSSDQIQFYIVDFASMILKNFEKLDHIGGVVSTNEEEKLENLFKMLLSEMASRKEQLAKIGISSYSAYLDAGFRELSQIVLVIDNFTVLKELYPKESEALLLISREGIATGISIILANTQVSGIGFKYLMNFPRRICLYCNDNSEYSNLFDRTRMFLENVPGRAFVEVDYQIIEAQMYLSFSGEKEIDRVSAIKSFVDNCNSANSGMPARKIPMVPDIVTSDELAKNGYDLGVAAYRIPLGIDYANMQLFHIDLLKKSVLAIVGGEKSGKTNIVKHIINCIQRQIFDNYTEVYIADDSGKLETLCEYGCVKQYVKHSSDAKAIIETVYEELLRRKEIWGVGMIDDTPMLMLVLSGHEILDSVLQDNKISDKLLSMVKDLKKYKVFVLLNDVDNAAINFSSPSLLKYVKEYYNILALVNISELRMIEVPLKFQKEYSRDIRKGDGYSFLDNKVRKIRFILNDEF